MNAEKSKKVWRREEIKSPCINICVIDRDTRLCVGCYRSIDEIAAWSTMEHEGRSAVMDELPAREKQFSRRPRKGRAARLGEIERKRR